MALPEESETSLKLRNCSLVAKLISDELIDDLANPQNGWQKQKVLIPCLLAVQQEWRRSFVKS